MDSERRDLLTSHPSQQFVFVLNRLVATSNIERSCLEHFLHQQ